MHNPESPTAHSIDAGFPMPVIYSDYLSDALDTGQADNILMALREIRRAMQDAPARKVCDFDLNLNDVFRVLKDSSLSPPLGN
jgi:hypothetical protein